MILWLEVVEVILWLERIQLPPHFFFFFFFFFNSPFVGNQPPFLCEAQNTPLVPATLRDPGREELRCPALIQDQPPDV